MKAEKTISAKITRPTISGVLRRERLLTLLDRKTEKPVVWVSAPAGSGKTTLVSTWLDSRNLPCIWYYCDEGDSDPATFFYYMGLAAKKAAPRRKKPLPLLTPEYLAGITTFTRSFFETLCSRLASSRASSPSREGITGVIVLDNYQDVPADSLFHELMDKGFAVARDGIRIVVISRDDPPPAFARMRAGDRMSLLRSGEILFTFDESRELALGRNPNLDDDYIGAMHEKTAGWAAGMILMLERGGVGGTRASSPAEFDYERVFDYFAGELFNRTQKEVRDFLLKTAVLPLLSVHLAEKLTGDVNAGLILSTLNRRHFFTERLSSNGQDYQYHPLFRDFLLSRAKTAFSPEELDAVRRDAASLLERDGRTEDAARLYCEAGDREGLGRIVVRHARDFLAQGRNRTVEEWIACIPGEPSDDNPWLSYWTGTCSFPLDMPRARRYLEKAFESFKAMEDTAGIYLSWAGIVDTYAFGLDEWKRLDDCITVFEGLRETWPSFPSEEIDLIVSSRMLFSLTLRKTDRPQLVHRWLQRVSALLRENPSFDIQMDTMFCMSVYYLWKGEYDKNAVLLQRAEAEIRHRRPSPFAVIRMKLMKGIHYWITAEYKSALNTLSEGLDLSGQSGVHVFDSLLWGFRAAAEMAPGNPDLAEQSLKNQMTALVGMEKTLDSFFFHVNSAWCAILKGNPSLAAEHMETASANSARLGTPYYRALWNIGMAQTVFLQGRAKDALSHVRTAHRISLAMKSSVMEWYSLLVEAWILLREGKETEGLLSLHRALSLGRRHGYAHLEFHQPSVMRLLYAKALEQGIEPEYVKGLIRKLGLTPPNPFASSPLLPIDKGKASGVIYLEEWPYPVKIYTLGRFEILKDDEPIHFSGKEQKKPLDLLKAVIAFGGRDVPEERLTDALWPEADGDLAHKSFETTLARLRRLLGNDACIRHRARQLTLNPLYCWVDTLALEHLFETIQESPGDRAALLREKAVALHTGPFLPSDSGLQWAVSSRETLKNRLLRIILQAARQCEEEGEWERAAEFYSKGIETDGLAEEFYRRLMVCHLNLGNNADAVKTFNRCRRLLRAELGIEPSAETSAVFSSIK